MASVADLGDPRAWPAARCDDEAAAQLHAIAHDAIVAATRREADAFDAKARSLVASMLARGDGRALAAALLDAPSLSIARHLHRLIADVECTEAQQDETIRVALFAIPVIVVAALDAGAKPAAVPGVVSNADALAAILRDAHELGGSETFGLSNALADVNAIDVAALPGLFARMRNAAEATPLDLPPAPIEVLDRSERVHVRFLAGALVASPRGDPFAQSGIGRWGMPFARALANALGAPGISLLALPRPAQRLVPAVRSGRSAQRDVAAQIFASNAIRKLRASLGEPVATLAAHAAAAAPGGGELRLTLASPFATASAEQFRCPLYAYEAVADVALGLLSLMRDCRVTDVRILPGVQPDSDSATGAPLPQQ